MGVSGFGPAPHRNLDEFERRLREIEEAEAAQESSRRRKLTGMTITLAGIVLISAALVLKGGSPTLLKRTSDALTADDIAGLQDLSGETAGRTADRSTNAAGSGVTPVAPEVDAQAVERLASQGSAQTTVPEPTGRPDGALIASQGSSAAKRWSAAGAPKPPARPASERMNGMIGAMPPSFELPPQRPGKFAARVGVGKTEAVIPSAAGDTPSPPVPIGTPVKPEKEPSGAKALRSISESVAVAATPAVASKQFPIPLLRALGDLLRALGDLFGALALSARQSIDPRAVGPTGWSVQLGAPRSQAEAKSDRTRLIAKYASALNGSTISERKAIVNGETVYRLRVVDLSKAGAEALCTRLKVDGGNCFIVK
jgi:hypothetical protein